MHQKHLLCSKCQAEVEVDLQESRSANSLFTIEKNQLSSSYIPTDSEVSQIMTTIHETQKDVDYLSRLITELQTRRDRLQRNLDHCGAVVSPVRRIPFEILSEIFSLCMHEDDYLHADLDVIHAPVLVLSQVCSTWRSVAMSLPQLWSRLSLNLACQRGEILGLVDLYLRRSTCFPLKIKVFAYNTYRDPSNPYAHYATVLGEKGCSVLSLLLQACTRWSEVTFDFHRIIYNHCRFQEHANNPSNWGSISDCFDNLRSLSFSWGEDYPDDHNSLFRLFIQSPSPLLYSLYLQEYFMSVANSLLSLKPGKISLSGVCLDIDLSHAFDIYGQNLRDLVLDVEYFNTANYDAVISESHGLLSLTINRSFEDVDSDSTSKIFSCLTLPSLIVLDLSVCEDGPQSFLKESLTRFIERSCCALEELKLSGNLFASAQDLIEVLDLTPTVTHLTLDVLSSYSLYLTQDFFQHFSYGVPLNTILPRLKTCRLAFQQKDPDVPLPERDPMLSMISSRRSFAPSLNKNHQRLELFGLSVRLLPTADAREWGSTITSRLRALARDVPGLELDIRFLTAK